MRIVVHCTVIVAASLLAGTAFAENAYIGLSRTTPGEAYANFATAQNVENSNTPNAWKLYGGFNLSDRYAIEAGYGAFGTWKITNPTAGSTEEVRITSSVVYLAGKAGLPVSDAFSLFGKIGLAANRFNTESSGLQAANNSSSVRPMLGFGANYDITKNIAAVLEFNYYGTAGQNFKQQKLELGLKFGF